MASVKGNIILNGINTITAILYPVVTFPYVARVLEPDGIGIVNFLNSIISYIVLVTSIGIPTYAVKEIAKYRDDKLERDKRTIEILCLSAVLCIIGYLLVWILATYVPKIHKNQALFYILSLTIVFTSIGVNWFYQGIENFKFITIRAVVIRTIAAVALFIFVKSPTDLIAYGIILVGSTVGNYFVNFIHLRKHLTFSTIKVRDLKVLRHLGPALHVFILNLIISLYIQLNTIMLGFMAGDDAVGYFTAGTKITHVVLMVIASIGTVLLPRCANLIKNGDMVNFKRIVSKSLNLIQALSFPMICGLILLATPVTLLFCGPEYIDSIPILYLNAPVIIFISLTNLMGMQILYPYDKVNIVIMSVSGGAITNILLNILLIPKFGATGAAISTFFAEFLVLVIQVVVGKKYYPFGLKELCGFKYLMAVVPMACAVALCVHPFANMVAKLLIGACIGCIVYILTLYVMKDSLLLTIFSEVRNKFKYGKQTL